MKAHEAKVYPYHLSFLKDFPHLADWLNCRGYVLKHSRQDFSIGVISTFWDNGTTEDGRQGDGDSVECIMVAYCRDCKTVEVFRRCIIMEKADEKALVDALDAKFTDHPDLNGGREQYGDGISESDSFRL